MRLIPLLLLFAVARLGLTQALDSPVAADSAELYIAFFQFHDDFSRWIDQRKAASSAQAAQAIDASIAGHFKIDPADLGKMRSVTNSVIANFRQIDSETAAYLNGRAKYEQPGDPAVLQQFLQRRQKAALAGAAQLQQVLSQLSWAGLHDYINNVHRLRLRNLQALRH